MTNITARAEHIRDRLARHWVVEVECAASPITLDEWTLIIDDLGPHARFGLGWPMPLDDPALSVPFCPELIDQVTSELSEADLDDYLGVIEFLADVQIAHICDGVDRERAVILAEDALNDLGPGSLVLFSDTQLSALDRHTDPPVD